ncbi:MAG TPA: hypothetical protein VNP04_15555 [Alphaproteobacteria bacterium]|nr:hypothetical protein [Alphaproteobacteria bacterium]
MAQEMCQDRDRHTIYCDCCGDQPMADIAGDRLIIKRVRGHVQHVAVICLHPSATEDANN